MNLLISFSGGETSAMMTYRLLQDHSLNGFYRYSPFDKALVVFANTGEENEQTLEFVRDCDREFGFQTVWVEAVVHHGERTASTHRVVTFDTASRHGEPYEEVIKKYGIPNTSFPHCTRELKENPIYSYTKSIGWENDTFNVAIGIRADESKRRDKRAHIKGLLYPMCDWGVTKRDVNTFWSKQPFRLRLTWYQGNCKWCWKKSDRKLLTIMDETPDKFLFPERMEQTYGQVGAEFKKEPLPGYAQRTFFRGHKTVQDLRDLHRRGDWEHAKDDSLDIDDGCVESCEIEWRDFGASNTSDPSLDAPVAVADREEE